MRVMPSAQAEFACAIVERDNIRERWRAFDDRNRMIAQLGTRTHDGLNGEVRDVDGSEHKAVARESPSSRRKKLVPGNLRARCVEASCVPRQSRNALRAPLPELTFMPRSSSVCEGAPGAMEQRSVSVRSARSTSEAQVFA